MGAHVVRNPPPIHHTINGSTYHAVFEDQTGHSCGARVSDVEFVHDDVTQARGALVSNVGTISFCEYRAK